MNLFIINKLAELTLMFQDIANICEAHKIADCDLEQKINVHPGLTKYWFRMWVEDKYLEVLISSDGSEGTDYIAKREESPAFFKRGFDDILKVIKQFRNEIITKILNCTSLPTVENEYGVNANEVLREWV